MCREHNVGKWEKHQGSHDRTCTGPEGDEARPKYELRSLSAIANCAKPVPAPRISRPHQESLANRSFASLCEGAKISINDAAWFLEGVEGSGSVPKAHPCQP